MALITYPLNNIEYTAEDAELYHATRTSGVFANDDFPITVSGIGNVVAIGEGIGWIRNSKFSGKVVANKSEVSVDLGLPHATYPRIDAVVLRFDANSNGTEIVVKNGTATSNPTAPEVVRTEAVYELHLYHVYRPAGATGVTSSNVTDLRSNQTYCGLMSDDVTMLGDDFVNKDMVGVAGGVASLDASGKVPTAQLPSMNYIPTSQKGVANGVATLDSTGKIPSLQLPIKEGTGTAEAHPAYGTMASVNCVYYCVGNVCFVYVSGTFNKTIGGNTAVFVSKNLPEPIGGYIIDGTCNCAYSSDGDHYASRDIVAKTHISNSEITTDFYSPNFADMPTGYYRFDHTFAYPIV